MSDNSMTRFDRAHRACIAWGHWVRDGRPKNQVYIRGTLGNPDRIFGDDESFEAYGLPYYFGGAEMLVDEIVNGSDDQPALAEKLSGTLILYYVRYHKSKPLLQVPERTYKVPDRWKRTDESGNIEVREVTIPARPARTITDIAEALGITRKTFYNRLVAALSRIDKRLLEQAGGIVADGIKAPLKVA